jgi:AcrR family transcriptional regulator
MARPRKIRDPSARERIVEAATRVVAAEGVQGATVRAIAAAAGVSTGFITHYFEDKHELIVAVLARNNQVAARRVLHAARTGTGLERLRAAVAAVLPLDAARRESWQVWVAVWGHASPEDELAEGYRAGWTGLRTIFAELLEQARSEGELRDGIDVSYEAERLVTMLAGTGLLAGVEAPTGARLPARRMLEEQLASLARNEPLATAARGRPAA